MKPTSQQVLEGSDQLRLIADFLEDLSAKVESEEERQLCYAIAEDCPVAANTYVQNVEIGQQGEAATLKCGVESELTSGNAA